MFQGMPPAHLSRCLQQLWPDKSYSDYQRKFCTWRPPKCALLWWKATYSFAWLPHTWKATVPLWAWFSWDPSHAREVFFEDGTSVASVTLQRRGRKEGAWTESGGSKEVRLEAMEGIAWSGSLGH